MCQPWISLQFLIDPHIYLSYKGLAINYGDGGLQQNGRGGGGASEVLPLRKGGAEIVLAMLKGGTTSFGVVLAQELEV